MRKSKTELLERFLADTIENDYSDLVKQIISTDGFETLPKDDHDYLNHGVYYHSRASIEIMLKHDFSLTHPHLLKNLCSALSRDTKDIGIYREIFSRLGKESVTALAKSMFDNESNKNNNNNPFYYLSMNNLNEDDKSERLDMLLSHIDLSQLSDDDIVSSFRHESIYANSQCLHLIKFFDNTGRLNSLSQDQLKKLFSYVSMNNDTTPINYCFQKGIFSKEIMLNSEDEKKPSFYLITELYHANHIDLEFINGIVGDKYNSEFYLHRFLDNFCAKYQDGIVELSHPAISFYCDLISGNITFQGEKIKSERTMTEALFRTDDIDVLSYMLNKILSEYKGEVCDILNSENICNIYKVSKRENNQVFMNFITTNKFYLDYVRSINQVTTINGNKASSQDYRYLQNDKLYFVGSNQNNEMEYTKAMLKAAPPSQIMVRGIINLTLHCRHEEKSFESGQRLLINLYPYMDDKSKEAEFKKIHWHEPDNFSLAKEFSALESSKTNERKFEKLICITFCPERYVFDYLEKAKRGKNWDSRIKLLLTLRCIDPFIALSDYSLSPAANTTLSEFIAEL